jgi:hypothetical protein
LERADVDIMIILKLMFDKKMGRYGMDSCRSDKKPVGGSCERDNEPLGVKK